MKKKILSYLSYGSLIIGAAIGLYALVKIYLIRSKLPAGVCPVTSNRPRLYIAFALCCISFLLSFFEQKTGKEQNDS